MLLAEVVAVGSRSKEKAEAFIREIEGAKSATAYGSYFEVLDDPKVAAVYIPLPTSMHLEWVKAAASKGKHVLLEKPIAMVWGPPRHLHFLPRAQKGAELHCLSPA
jgi:predicted dehydrogenase